MTKLGIISNKAQAASEKLVARGMQAKNAQMLVSLGLIGLIIAAVIGLIALIVLLVKHLKSISPEGKLKAAEEAAKKASEQVEKLNEEFNTLKESLDSIAEKRAALDELTYGTQEWRDAVREVNNEMLKVAQLDPDLAPFITNNNGVLEFDYNKVNYKGQTYDDVMEQKQVDLETAQQIEIGSKIEVEYREIDKERATNTSGIISDVGYGTEGTFVDKYGNSQVGKPFSEQEALEINEKIARAMISGDLITTGVAEEDLEIFTDYLVKEFGYSASLAEDMARSLVAGRDGLLQFGNALLESEGQIAAYTNTLVAGAVANSGLVDEEADIAQTYLDSRIEGIIESEKERLRSTELGDAEKEEYARIMGYTYDNGNFYSLDAEGNKVKEEGITDDLIIEQIAYSNAIKIGTGYMKNFANNISGASKKLGDGLGTLLEETYAAADGMGITKETLDNIDLSEDGDAEEKAGTIYDALSQQFGSETEAMFGTREEFVAQQIKAWNNAALAYANATELIGDTFSEGSGISAMLNGLITEFNLTAGEAKALSNALYDVAMNGGDAATFLKQVNTMLAGLTGEDRDRALALINSTDWTDKDSVNNTLNALEDLGVVIGDDFKQQILEATQATREFSMDRINDELKKTAEVLNIVSEKAENGEVTYTQEEYEALVAAGVNSKDFVYTNYDEWTYLGETNDLLAAIEGTTEAILQEMGGGLQEDIAKGEAAVAWGEQKADQVGYETKAEVIEGLRNNDFYINDYNNQNAFAAKAFLSTDEINKIATEFGIDTTDLSTDAIVERIISYWDTYAGGLETNQAKQEEYNRQYGVMQYSDMSGQEILDATDNGYKNLALDAAGVKGGTQIVERATKAMEDYNKELKESGVKTEVLQERSGKFSKIAKALAYDVKQEALAQDNLNSVLEENVEAFKNAAEGSGDYNNALYNITQAAQQVFGEDLTEDFVKAHDDLFIKMAEGGAEAQKAYEEIGKLLAEDYISSLNNGISATETFAAIAAGLPDDIEVGMEFDASEAINNLIALGYTAAEAASIMEKMGYTVTFRTERHYFGKTSGLDYGTGGNVTPGDYKREGGFEAKEIVVAAGVKNSAGGTGFSGGGGGGGGGGKDDTWENPYDEFYNITEQINEELRTREQIEHDYNKLLKDRRTSIDEIRQSQLDQIASLRRELDLQQQLLEGRKRQYSEIGQETYADEEGNYKSFSEWGVTKYASYDDKTGLITIDWEGIDQITDTELGGAVEAYISQIEEWSGSIEDIEDEIRDIEDQIEEIKNAEKDTYLEFEERIYEALVEADQKVIDTYQELSDTISDSNEKILNSLSESIELERQIRDNTKTEEEIADKEARLAYLRRDTSGANDLEIKQLEEELADARESYSDTLIDQELDRLNKVNEEANAQREQQISLMQAQLDWNEQNGIYWARVDSLLSDAINSDGTFNYNSELATILEDSEAFKGMSAFGQMNWINELVEEFLTANRGFENWMVDRAEEEGMVVLADGKTASYNKDNQTWTDESGNSYEDLVYSADTKTYSLANPIKKEETEGSDTSTDGGGTSTPEVEKPVLDENTKRGVSAAIWRGSSTSGWGQGSTRAARLKEVFGENDIQENYVNKNVMTGYSGSVSDYTYANMKKKFLAYKTGGLADFTGPAWLDGTKARPELVLNQQDTQNFIQLKDILSSLLNRGSVNTQTSGDNYYNFDITVEEIGSDYDVDQMIDRVRERIYDDASYRNVNAINFLR